MKIEINRLKPALCAADENFHALVRLQSEPEAGLRRVPLNLVLVIDRSGSMSGSKLIEAKRCAIDLMQRLSPTDRVGVVQYDETVDVVVPLTSAGLVGATFVERVNAITANGSTDLHAGWLKGGELLAPHAGHGSVCHVILLSDGQANHGIVQPERICEQVASLASAGITTTTVGLGTDFNEQLMTAMAQSGQGRAHYGERAMDLAETFDAEMGLLTHLQWRSVELSVQGASELLTMVNPYDRIEGGWRMPSVALGSECWALIRMPMREAIRLQQEAETALSIRAAATNSAGVRHTFSGQLPTLPVVSATEYAALPAHELVQRRINELNAAQIQLRIRDAALNHDWQGVKAIMGELEAIGRHEAWVASSIEFMRELVDAQDAERTSKEMMYRSRRMSQRLASVDERLFAASEQAAEPSFLRRKVSEGRRTEE